MGLGAAGISTEGGFMPNTAKMVSCSLRVSPTAWGHTAPGQSCVVLSRQGGGGAAFSDAGHLAAFQMVPLEAKGLRHPQSPVEGSQEESLG